MKKIKFISSFVLLISLAASLFSACQSEETEITTAVEITRPVSTKIYATDYTYNTIFYEKSENTTDYIRTAPAIPTEENKTEKKTDKTNVTNNNTDSTTVKASDEKIEELSKELNLITKTSPVMTGNSATIIIQGTPDAKYTIEFYKNDTVKADYDGLDEIKADSSGFASWTFMIENDCMPGNRKIIIKEKNSNRFIQTSIKVQ